MRFKNLDLNLLAALDLLLTERNVSRAAERIGITQSAMSNALARLRQYFGDDLLVQVGRRLEPTPRAEMLAGPVRDILVRIESSITAAPDFDPRISDRVFHILVSDYTLTTLVPDFLRRVEAQNLSVGFEFLPQTDQASRALERGEADLLIIPEDYSSEDHPIEILYEETFVAVAAQDHPRIGAHLDCAGFQAERHAVMKPAINLPSFESIAIQELGLTRHVDVTSFSFAALPLLVIGTERLAILHRRMAERVVRYLPLKMLELPFDLKPMRQCAQWHSYRSADPAIGWLRDQIIAAAQQYGE
ncbi:MAG: LysR family transcriptional regulator [Paracoccus sp. (in: a-proteobacteria)]|uniref:LysR family transcriptional regulator n=1 Tax=Paracoccus sp. TaxID=267 RepID=UPI0026DF4368|nr:LysR family transcriptional regulator [Paracoccus sp. (in: a-proteobacteria)]MDO5620955.1 LysR family transcriptional regulator [Paracoccus sp. (in: a-proteobacteria)]